MRHLLSFAVLLVSLVATSVHAQTFELVSVNGELLPSTQKWEPVSGMPVHLTLHKGQVLMTPGGRVVSLWHQTVVAPEMPNEPPKTRRYQIEVEGSYKIEGDKILIHYTRVSTIDLDEPQDRRTLAFTYQEEAIYRDGVIISKTEVPETDIKITASYRRVGR